MKGLVPQTKKTPGKTPITVPSYNGITQYNYDTAHSDVCTITISHTLMSDEWLVLSSREGREWVRISSLAPLSGRRRGWPRDYVYCLKRVKLKRWRSFIVNFVTKTNYKLKELLQPCISNIDSFFNFHYPLLSNMYSLHDFKQSLPFNYDCHIHASSLIS